MIFHPAATTDACEYTIHCDKELELRHWCAAYLIFLYFPYVFLYKGIRYLPAISINKAYGYQRLSASHLCDHVLVPEGMDGGRQLLTIMSDTVYHARVYCSDRMDSLLAPGLVSFPYNITSIHLDHSITKILCAISARNHASGAFECSA